MTPRTAVGGRRAGRITEVDPPYPLLQLEGEHRAYRTASNCSVILAWEPARRAPERIWVHPLALFLWHLSISHKHRYPSWDEIADIRYELVPSDVTMAMLLPPMESYINLSETTFHLWQIEDRRIPGC